MIRDRTDGIFIVIIDDVVVVVVAFAPFATDGCHRAAELNPELFLIYVKR